jgi:hypothetical protein
VHAKRLEQRLPWQLAVACLTRIWRIAPAITFVVPLEYCQRVPGAASSGCPDAYAAASGTRRSMAITSLKGLAGPSLNRSPLDMRSR